MGVVERCRDLARDAQCSIHAHRTPAYEQVTKRSAFDHRRHVEQPTARITGVVQRENVRMVEARNDPDFPKEEFGADHGTQDRPEDLDGDGTMMLEVVREVDSGHPALPEKARLAVGRGLDPIAIGECGRYTIQRLRHARPW
jgi:hypothetical protein